MLRECCQHLDLEEKVLARSGRDWISRRRWMNDTQEMRRLIYYAALTAPGRDVEASHFPPRGRIDHEAYTGAQLEVMSLEDVVGHKLDHFFCRLGSVEVSGVYNAVLAQVERSLIEKSLKWAKGNRLKAARALGLDRNTLRRKIKELNIKI